MPGRTGRARRRRHTSDDDTTADLVAPRRRPHAVVALAAGSLAGLVLGVGGITSAQETTLAPALSATAAQEAPAEGEAAEREPCDEGTGSADAPTSDEQA